MEVKKNIKAIDISQVSFDDVLIENLDVLDFAAIDLIVSKIKTIPGFPKKEVHYRDLMPAFADHTVLRLILKALEKALPVPADSFEYVAGLESRGFLLAAPLAQNLDKGLICLRKKGKLPPPVISKDYDLEYGTATIEMEESILPQDARVLIVDDLLATGGTASAASDLLQKAGAIPVGFSCVVELLGLSGRECLGDVPVSALIAMKA